MPILKKLWQAVQYPFKALLQVIRYVSAAVLRIFSPSDEQYPATGVQPFEGAPAERKKMRHE